MALTGNFNRILQIHPSRRCNLHCLHCYSASGPEERDQLSVPLLLKAITNASEQGYTITSFSGGEPLVYKPLPELLKQAHQCQMRTTVTSNGILLDERHLEQLCGAVDLLAISLDGMPASHNRIRSSEQAFEKMAARLEGVRQSGIPFGFIFTLTKRNFRELDWVANFALEQGAKLLQIHPLAEVGYASQNLMGSRPSTNILSYAYLKTLHLREAIGDKLFIQIDLVHQDLLRSNPGNFFADEALINQQNYYFADLVSPLIIEADGTVVPVQHGFDRNYALGNLNQASLSELATHWTEERYPCFRELCRRVYQQLTAPADLPIIDWYETLMRQAKIGYDNETTTTVSIT
ncbi:MAG: radical SAM/SPASM domain-containing protein [Nostoc sp. ZfuVER08]|uniref:Radical SAM protein n=1 Tax=Nostoc punctiforme FACHB-252 TaxID=1357509 RepID=A0ABR8HL59_NOSPU|nr:radical SAM/SPASM domain-containing protein [Nostoc punctiforme]MBD2616096.1 radical SAM protein [Nostoc punctiforme FACHB-252]MDZ8014899.1 radical SAM/SPASM domain-containing protein [Nostoc sp. ZfuVER08]